MCLLFCATTCRWNSEDHFRDSGNRTQVIRLVANILNLWAILLALIYLLFTPALGLKKECRVQRGHSLGLCISSDGIVVSAMTFYNGKLIMALDSWLRLRVLLDISMPPRFCCECMVTKSHHHGVIWSNHTYANLAQPPQPCQPCVCWLYSQTFPDHTGLGWVLGATLRIC